MAITPLVRIPTLTQTNPFVDEQRRLTNEALRTLNGALSQLGNAVNQLAALPEIQAALEAAKQAVIVAQDAAQAAQDAADAAQGQADATKREAALTLSYIDPDSVVTADPTTVFIAAHTRYYNDGTSVAVNGGSGPATAPNDINYASYVDPMRAGGAVTYIISTIPPTQTGDTHVVGAVMIPDDGVVDGGSGPTRPGAVYPNKFGVSEL